MNTLFKIKNSAMILALGAMVFTSCSDDDEPEPTPTPGANVVTSNISANTTWTTGNIYVLGGRIAVTNGATLTIQEGVIVKGQAGTGPNATALIIARGSKIDAQGTATAPIIFTSVADEIEYSNIQAGNFASPNLDPDANGFWGGVIILGSAPISASAAEVQIEGIPTSDPNGLYGGNNAADNSGIIKYISIRHGGSNIGSGNEINGLTLGGVGSGTVIENIEIVGNQDDGIEWFGGSVNVTNAVVWNCGDDGIDTDQSWAGTLDNFVVIGALGHAFELDGPEGTLLDSHTIRNGSIKMSFGEGDNQRVSEDIINTDANSRVDLSNLYFTDLQAGQIINRINAVGVTFDNIILNVPASELPNYVVDGAVPASVISGTTPQANISILSWTWCSQAGAMSGL